MLGVHESYLLQLRDLISFENWVLHVLVLQFVFLGKVEDEAVKFVLLVLYVAYFCLEFPDIWTIRCWRDWS